MKQLQFQCLPLYFFPKMPEFYTIIARKIFFLNFWRARPPLPPPPTPMHELNIILDYWNQNRANVSDSEHNQHTLYTVQLRSSKDLNKPML